MRIYCWDYPSYDDIPKKYKYNTLQFVNDTPAGTKAACGYCGKEIILKKDIDSCPNCGKDLVYGRVDW